MAPKINRSSKMIIFSLILIIGIVFSQIGSVEARGDRPVQRSQSPLVSKPRLQSPDGTITLLTPTFQWGVVNQASIYQFQLMSGTIEILTETYSTDICDATSCFASPEITLIPGTYKWRARAYATRWSSYSRFMTFTVTSDATQEVEILTASEVPTQEIPTATQAATEVPTQEIPTTNQAASEVPTQKIPTATQAATEVPTREIPTATQTASAEPTRIIPTANLPVVEEPTQEIPTASPTASPVPTQEDTSTGSGRGITPPARDSIHAIGLTWPDYSTSRSIVAQVEQQLKDDGMNMVALNAGRVEWNFFKWANNEATWAGSVEDTGIDFLAEDAARFGKWAHVDAMIDVFAPVYIQAHPEKAAINALGVASPYLVSTVEMVSGEFSQRLLAMVEYIAANYPVNSISFTELQYRVDGYGPDDTASYLAYSGRTDWPRQSNGQIDIDDTSIGNWRSYMLGTLLNKATLIAHMYGKQFFMDVSLNVNNMALMSNNKGQNYNVMLQNVDKIIVWGYFAEDQYPPETFVQVGQFLSTLGKNRVILSIGLWGPNSSTASAESVKIAIESAQAGGMANLWITPFSMLSSDHWKVINQLWSPNL